MLCRVEQVGGSEESQLLVPSQTRSLPEHESEDAVYRPADRRRRRSTTELMSYVPQHCPRVHSAGLQSTLSSESVQTFQSPDIPFPPRCISPAFADLPHSGISGTLIVVKVERRFSNCKVGQLLVFRDRCSFQLLCYLVLFSPASAILCVFF